MQASALSFLHLFIFSFLFILSSFALLLLSFLMKDKYKGGFVEFLLFFIVCWLLQLLFELKALWFEDIDNSWSFSLEVNTPLDILFLILLIFNICI